MALSPLEWLIIGAIVLVVVFWGPKKLPELARALGRAKKEFDSAAKEVKDVSEDLRSPLRDTAREVERESTRIRKELGAEISSNSTVARGTIGAGRQSPSDSEDDVLIETAKQIGIMTDGKTKEEISREMVERASKRPDETHSTKSS